MEGPKMVARLADEEGRRSPRHGVYRWGDLPVNTWFYNRLIMTGHARWQQKNNSHSFHSELLVEADPPAPPLTVTLPPELVEWICSDNFQYTRSGENLQSIVREARDAQEA